MRSHLVAAVAAAAVSFAAPSVHAASLTGAGGTAIYPVLAKWADQYAKENGDTVNYQAIGSGGGIKQIELKTVLFANSDMPLKPDDVAKNGLVQFPQVIISITPVVHLKGIKPGELVFDGATLANIYLGNIKEWDDPAIKKLNPKVKLPHQAISTVHRSDGSGTTFNFTNYLSKVSADWKSKVGDGTSVNWPNGVGGKGNAGVASYVQQVDGAIGYVEYAYVMENKLIYTDMVNKAGIPPRIAIGWAAHGRYRRWRGFAGWRALHPPLPRDAKTRERLRQHRLLQGGGRPAVAAVGGDLDLGGCGPRPDHARPAIS